MRSSKNRSRSKGNRNRQPGGNIVNRVFDSSGPEGKVRGTPQQIIDKYNQLTRDAQLSNDRVAAENFQQHAEHYLRMLAEAQREQEAKREQQQGNQQQGSQNQGNDQQGNDQQAGNQQNNQGQGNRGNRQRDRGGDQTRGDPSGDAQPQEGRKPSRRRGDQQPAERGFDEVIESGQDGDSGLVETPESAPKPKRTRKPKKTEGEGGSGSGGSPDSPPKEAAE